MGRVFNFSAGPGALPVEVLEQARDEMLDCAGTGMSVMEMSHRSEAYMAIINQAEASVRKLMGVPAGYKVLFLQGGASLQFAMVPMNLAGGASQAADYIVTGSWSKKAMKEAKRLLSEVRVAASSEGEKFSRIPAPEEMRFNPDAAYVHLTSNNTIYGTEFSAFPDTGKVPLVVDASSNVLSRPMDIGRLGLLYAGAQKNLGPSGVTLVIVREDLLGKREGLPAMLDYAVHAENGSMYNTPPTYAIYILGLVLSWVEKQGGVAEMERRNLRKAALLYRAIDESGGFYRCPAEVGSRSRMNVAFTLANPELDKSFLKLAKEAGLVSLKGHRSVGGMRASIYNAMPEAGVAALVEFMGVFRAKHG
ncbi:MAG: 3-phosphoserine/phosphohydroxythreonine transaminase [Magnetococcales bacterium]|nr:3-phosphoserine/phosphohydroxythreonine transaminase [Magnetococcales bacterium]MBF0156836.1 3-phosphoserine/phosphohydroxythreonine transaminase [Magnetococcales bacterium]